MVKKKQTKKPKPGIWKEVERIPDTPQSMADGFRFYAETITKLLNKYAYKQHDDELKRDYITYRQTIDNWCKFTKEYLEIDLPEPPTLKDDGYYDVMVRLAEWCKNVAAKGFRKPLTKKARLIRNKLESLREGEGMTTPELQDWYYDEYEKNLDEGTWKNIRKELLPYGLKNAPKIGYYFLKITS